MIFQEIRRNKKRHTKKRSKIKFNNRKTHNLVIVSRLYRNSCFLFQLGVGKDRSSKKHNRNRL